MKRKHDDSLGLNILNRNDDLKNNSLTTKTNISVFKKYNESNKESNFKKFKTNILNIDIKTATELISLNNKIEDNSIENVFSSEIKRPLSKSTDLKGKITKEEHLEIYSLGSLKNLFEIIKNDKEDERNENPTKLRFLIDNDYKLWFAREYSGPAHYKLTGESNSSATCLTAGNITFSSDFKTILMINHKSGDFHPSFDSIKFLLAIIVFNELNIVQNDGELPFIIPETLIIQKLYQSNSGLETEFVWNKSDIIDWVQKTFADEKQLKNQPSKSKMVTYLPSEEHVERQMMRASNIVSRKLHF